MDNWQFQRYLIEDRSYVSFIKREIHHLVKSHFNETRAGEIDIVVSEMTSNLIKHANSGELLYRLNKIPDVGPVFEMLCIDNGPGIRDVGNSIKDGVSTTSTLGHGMGSIFRLSTLAQVYSQPDWGTIVYTRFYRSEAPRSVSPGLLVRCINVAKPGETVSGDGIAYKMSGSKSLLFAGDGLGHGIHAKEVMDKAIEVFHASHATDAAQMLFEINQAVKRTRGLVATVAVLNHKQETWEVCGVGNIHTRLQRGLEYKNYICNNGIVGLNIPKRLENSSFPMEKLQMVVLCSDGIKTKWDLIKYPSILKYDPMMLAAAIYKDHKRTTDDMTVLIAKVL